MDRNEKNQENKMEINREMEGLGTVTVGKRSNIPIIGHPEEEEKQSNGTELKFQTGIQEHFLEIG